MKIANKTKIGILAVVAVTGLILGFNFLKGSSLFEHTKKLYAVFSNVEGLEVSNVVQVNGLNIGTVAAINESDRDLTRGIVVTIVLKKDVHIPRNSMGVINSGLISSSTIVVTRGDDTRFLNDGDTLRTVQKPNLLSQVQQSINPVIIQLNGTLQSLDSLVKVIGTLFNPKLKNNLSAIVANLATSSASLQTLLNAESGELGKALKNVDQFTGNLAKNNDHVSRTLENLDKTSANLAAAKIPETLESLQSTVTELKGVVSKVNSPN